MLKFFCMGLYFNHPNYREARRELRHDQTFSEKLFWNCIRANQLGVHFRRQYSVQKYILDFYCSKLKLAIELDGAVHFTDEAKGYDEERTVVLNGFGIEVVRFTNDEIASDLDRVIEKIKTIVEKKRLGHT